MELGWFRKSPIVDVLESGFVEARLHTDGTENIERILALQELYVGDVGLPNYVIIDPSDESKHGRYAEGACVTAADAEGFTAFLKKGLREINAPAG